MDQMKKEKAEPSTNENVESKCGKIDDKLFEKELENEKTKLLDAFGPMNGEQQSLAIRNFARHFYELGLNAKKEESVSVAESPSKTFPRVNEFDCGSSYRH